jgi:hypothetical protein
MCPYLKLVSNFQVYLTILAPTAEVVDPEASNPTVNGINPVAGEGGEILTRVQRYFSKKKKRADFFFSPFLFLYI